MKPARHKLDVWPATVWAASTGKQLAKVSKMLGCGPLNDEGCAGRTFSVNGPTGYHIVVYVDAKHQESRMGLVNTCAHEAAHAVDYLFEYVDEEKPGAESRAYLTGWVTEFVMAHCEDS